jgi:hypothetical protein
VQNLFVKIGADYDGTFAIRPKDFYDGDTVIVEGRYRDVHGHWQEFGCAGLPHIQASWRQSDELPAVRRRRRCKM